MSSLPNNVITRKKTPSNDLMFKLVDSDMWFSSVNVTALLNDAFYGDRVDQDSPFYVSDVFYFDAPTNLNELYFKNLNAGSNCKIVATGVLILKAELKRLGLE